MTSPARRARPHIAALALTAALAACSRQAPPAVAGQAQPLFVNGGFEDGTRSSWTFTAKRNTNGLAAVPPTTYAQLQLSNCTLGTNCYDYTYVRTGATPESVPLYGLANAPNPPKLPKFGTYSLVVNEGGKNYNVNTVQQSYTTTSADVDPADGKIHVRFALAPALQNPNHPDNEQPYFFVILRNVTKANATLYQTFNFANQSGVPWITYNDPVNGAVQYTNWQVFDVAPGNGLLTVGDTINLEVVAAGCNQSGHWGEVALDGFGAQIPSLSIGATGPAAANAGTDITYAFQAKNSTSFLTSNVVVTMATPPTTTFKSIVPPAGVTCTTPAVGATGTITCPLGWMNPAASVPFQVTVNINSGATGTINNGNYTIGGDGVSPILGALVQTTITAAVTYADLGVTVSDGTPGVVWGGPVAYTLTVGNGGPSAVVGATVTDTFPAQLTGVTWTCTATGGGACQSGSGSGNISRTVNLPVGATATFAISATVIAGSGSGTLTNSASVAPPAGVTDPGASNNTDADVDGIGTLYAVTAAKDLAETGQGQVISSPAGISCGNSCASQSASYLDGSQVTLTAIARAGDTFTGWTGGCTGTANACTITLGGAPVTATAHFRGPAVTGSAPGGNGSVTCSPSPVVQGSSSSCAIAPSAGYQLTALTDNGANVLGSVAGGAYALSNLAVDHAVVATFMKSNATGCGAGTECASGICTDGVCCDAACGGQCQACTVPGSVGTCSPVTGAPLGGRAACASDGSACGGACDGVTTAACAYPGGSTSCRSASCAAGTATLAASCSGTGSCPAVQTVSCNPYVCGATACLGACLGDAQCVAGDWCNATVCQPRKTNGATCSAANECTSGNCVDGYCCNSACNGQCQACDIGSSAGTCTPIAAGLGPHGGRPACASDGSACGGACDGANGAACAYPGSSTACRSASCAAGTATLAASCAGTGSCPAVQTQACAPFVCGATACLASCTSDVQCAAGDYCTAGTCQPKKANGETCTFTSQCLTGNCVDGVCCDSACGGQCQACNLTGSVGTCSPATGAPVGGRPACASDGSACGGACDGTNGAACAYPGGATSCRSASCAGGTATLAASCTGTGSCPAAQTQACAPFVCGAGACLSGCSDDSQCVAGDYCAAGTCQPRQAGGTCSAANQCTSGHCVDGVCCDTACDGQCEACDVPGSAGTCTAVTGAPVAPRTACESDGGVCGGSCDGTRRNVCAYPADQVACRAPGCAAGTATLAASCDGAGHCPAVQTQVCAPLTCNADASACLGNCASDSECTSGNWCSGGVCVPVLADGTACGADDQCANGHCADGVCCDSACDGQCEACNLPSLAGTCSPVTGAPVNARQACTDDGSACGGACDGQHRTVCGYPQADVSCRAPSCAGGSATLGASCDGTGRCPAVQTQACAPFTCDPAATACLGNCAADTDCATGNWCSAGVCAPLVADGGVCSGPNQCANGHCVDGVCCDTGCTGQCEACNLPGLAGSCAPVAGAPVNGRPQCASDGSACGGACDGVRTAACAYPDDSIPCRGASCSGGVATLGAACDGAGSCPSPQQRTCAPYVCGATACAGDCTSDSDCATGSWCSAGVCVPAIANGTACGADDQCANGHCVDGVCCDTACNGQCEACDVPGSAGSCTAVAGAPHGGRTTCATDGSACGGACDGQHRTVCGYPGTETGCRAAGCASGVATLGATCDGSGSCPAVQTQVCAPLTCNSNATACLGNCAADGDCAAGNWCSAGVCAPLVADGGACSGASQCQSGHCTDGVCCDTACNGQCQACNLPGLGGTCSPATGAPANGRPQCASDGSACGGACDGVQTAACAYPGVSTSCRAASCAGGVATLGASCDGAGSCPSPQQQTCAPFVCGAAACAGNCVLDGDCAAGSWCSGGVCVATLAGGQVCARDAECGTGHCVDGVCCDTACNGQCQACDVAGHAGSCTPVAGPPHGGRTTCATDGTACAGACDGQNPAACAYPGPETTCHAEACTSGVATGASVCGGAGACGQVPASTSCGAYACTGAVCATACASSADCSTGNVCDAGACVASGGTPSGSGGGWHVSGSGGCSATGGTSLAALALLAVLLLPLRARRSRRGAAVAAALLAIPALARAQASTAIAVQRFQPLGGARDLLGVPSARIPDHLELGGAVFLDFASEPLRLVPASGTSGQEVSLVSSQTVMTVAATIGLLDRFELSLALPVALQSSGDPASSADPSFPSGVPGTGLGDLRFTPKARIAEIGAWRLAVAMPVSIPTATSAYLGQGGITASPLAVAEVGPEHGWRVAGNVGVVLRSAQQLLNLDQATAVTFGVAGEVPFHVGDQRFTGLATLAGEIGSGWVERPAELLAAVRWAGPQGVNVTVGGGPGLSHGYGTPHYRMLAAVNLAPIALRHAEREPVESARPVAPAPVALAAAAVDPPAVSAPPAPEPEPAHAGAPLPPPSDPAPEPKVALASAVVAAPEPPAAGGAVPLPPPEVKVVLQKNKIAILEQVHFATDRDVILQESFELLNQVARVLRENPQLTRVRVEGHTDSKGPAAHNVELSQRRARTVREFLVKGGIAAGRLESQGYGPSRPIASNDTDEGRARNRRVEFAILAQEP